eukprot:m.334739 g.334739  ORF g.334739 m.334739 type:complete len:187 (+) comp17424_c0_seq1:242-802(+)
MDDCMENCAICLESLSEKGLAPKAKKGVTKMLKVCGHTFHKACVDEWFASEARRAVPHLTCPLCRAQVAVRVIKVKKDPNDPNSGFTTPQNQGSSSPRTTARRKLWRLLSRKSHSSEESRTNTNNTQSANTIDNSTDFTTTTITATIRPLRETENNARTGVVLVAQALPGRSSSPIPQNREIAVPS